MSGGGWMRLRGWMFLRSCVVWDSLNCFLVGGFLLCGLGVLLVYG